MNRKKVISTIKKRCVLILLVFIVNGFFSTSIIAQSNTVTFEQLDSLQRVEKRPVVVFLHTVWCKYCGAMKATTFKNKEVEKQLNQKFYFIALDIEEKADILFRGYTFKYKPTGVSTGVHELAEQLGTINGAIGYPTLCFLNTNYEIIYQREGYTSAKAFLEILLQLTKSTP